MEKVEIKDIELLPDNSKIEINGRVKSIKNFGKLIFITITDIGGTVQISFRLNKLNEKFVEAKENIKIGDIILVRGTLYKTQADIKTIECEEYEIIAKNKLKEELLEYGQTKQIVENLSNPKKLEKIKNKLEILKQIKLLLESKEFLSLEGIFDNKYTTQINFLFAFLAGINKAYNINRTETNINLEMFITYEEINNIKEEIILFIKKIIKLKFNKLTFNYQGLNIDFNEIEIVDFKKEISEFLKLNIDEIKNASQLKQILIENNIFYPETLKDINTINDLLNIIFEKKIQKYIINPIIVYNFPEVMNKNKNEYDIYLCSKYIGKFYDYDLNLFLSSNPNYKEIINLIDSFGLPSVSLLQFNLDKFLMILTNDLKEHELGFVKKKY